jgi:hypothetical protein
MGGAYVAKPDADTTPDVPEGWNINWTFPGPPLPPGYERDLSLVISANETVVAGQTATATVTLYDHESYATSEPTGLLTLTGTIEDVISGGEGSFALSGEFYIGTLDYVTTELDVGKTINWAASSDPFGLGIISKSATTEVIEEEEYIWKFTITLSDTVISGDASVGMSITDETEQTTLVELTGDGEEEYTDIIEGHQYYMGWSVGATPDIPGYASSSYSITIYLNDELQYSKSGSGEASSPPGEEHYFDLYFTIGEDHTLTIDSVDEV